MNERPFFEYVSSASDFLYFRRRWWPAGFDVVAFWREQDGQCRRYAWYTGPRVTWDGISGEVVLNDSITSDQFTDLVEYPVKYGILTARSQKDSFATIHAVDLYMAKVGERPTNEFQVSGGLMKNEVHDKIRTVFLGDLGLRPYLLHKIEEREKAFDKEQEDDRKKGDV